MEILLADSLTDYMGMGIGFCMVVLVPLVWLFLHHQRKMAEMFHRLQAQQQDPAKLDRLEGEVRELKDRINELILQREPALPPSVPEELRARL